MALFDYDADTFWDFAGKGMTVIGVTLLLFLTVGAWVSSCKSAQIYNRINNTSFSCSDFFWASAQINSQTQTIKLTK